MTRKKPLSVIMGNENSSHLTKAEIIEREAETIKAPNDKIEAPAYLTVTLKREFNRIAKELKNINIMSNLDCESLARFIISEFQYQKIVKKILKLNIDDEKYMDTLLMQEKLFKMARISASDLGLTISSRCKLVVPKELAPVDPIKDRFGNL